MNYTSPVSNTQPYNTQDSRKRKLHQIDPQVLRYAQSSMKDETTSGLPIPQLIEDMKSDGYDPRHPIRVVRMPPGKNDSPNGKLVAFDTRRTKAARAASREMEDFFAVIEEVDYNQPAEEEYRQLEHLTFKNKRIPEHIRKEWIKGWNDWHRDSLLRSAKIKPRTWGHLIKLRMAMSIDKKKWLHADTHNGFKESPYVRQSRKNRARTESSAKKLMFK